MSFFSSSQADAAQAQAILAQISGMPPGAPGNTLFAGQTVPVTGVYGTPRVLWLPVPGGGYRKQTEVVLKITRVQLNTAPVPNTKLTRLDLTPKVDYIINHVDTQQALFWVLILKNFAG